MHSVKEESHPWLNWRLPDAPAEFSPKQVADWDILELKGIMKESSLGYGCEQRVHAVTHQWRGKKSRQFLKKVHPPLPQIPAPPLPLPLHLHLFVRHSNL
jgi:hypothetical protein